MCPLVGGSQSAAANTLTRALSQVDGEVESFERLPVAKVAEAVADGRFKPNCNLVIVDFLVRHGYLQPEDPGYVPLVHSLRRLTSD